MRIIYAADYFKPKLADEQFRPEAQAFASEGFSLSTINVDELETGSTAPTSDLDDTTLYRGWMLSSEVYSRLVASIENAGSRPFTTVEQYLLTHHIPNWAPRLGSLTAETVVLPNGTDFESELRALGWREFFVKDYVKSLKVSMGSRISDPGEIGALVEEMAAFRGTIEGGLCIRRVEELLAETEMRYFVINGVAHAPDGSSIPKEVEECIERIASPFFSVDVALNSKGKRRVVEVGDGQVSDTVGWDVSRFASLFTDDGFLFRPSASDGPKGASSVN